MGFSAQDAHRTAKFRASWVGHVGDVSWEDHGGGPVYADPHYPGQFRLAYVEPPYDDEDTHWHVYDIDLDPHSLADSLGLDYHTRQLPLHPPKELKSLASYRGQDWKDYARAVWSGNPMALASVAEDIASYGGWENALNADAEHLTRSEFIRSFGEEPSHNPEEEATHQRGRRRR
jgi:hypothetical protein